MAARKKVDGRTKEGRARKARALARKGIIITKAKPRTKVRIVRRKKRATQKVGEPRIARRVRVAGKYVAEVKRPRKGSVVVTQSGFIGRLDSIVGDMANVVLVEGLAGFNGVAIVPVKGLAKATSGEAAVFGTLRSIIIGAYNAGRTVATSEAARLVERSVEAVEAQPAVDPAEAEALAVVAEVLKGRIEDPVESVHNA